MGYEEIRYEEMRRKGARGGGMKCPKIEFGLAEIHEGHKSKNAKKKWVRAGGILLAALLTACGGEENNENSAAPSSVVELDNIMDEMSESSDGAEPSPEVDEKDFPTQNHDQQGSGNQSYQQSGAASDPGAGSAAQEGQSAGAGSAAQADTASTPEPIEEKLTPEGIGWGLSFGDSGTQPVGNASPQELALYDAYFMKEGDEKVIYLTFDCGYENGNTEKILDALKAHNAPATFFVVGHFLETEPEIVNRMAEEGHAVGNHTYHHYDIDTLDADSFRKELEDVETLFNEITGETLSHYYRPPEGKCGTTNLELAKDLGYVTCFWSLAYVDWDPDKQPTHEAALDKLTARIHPGAIVLLHNTSQTNGEILDELLTKWEEMGYTFAPLSDLSD